MPFKSAEKAPAVWVKRHVVDVTGVPLERPDRRAARDRPQFHKPVVAATCDVLLIRARRDRPNPAVVSGDRPSWFGDLGRGVPPAKCSLIVATDERGGRGLRGDRAHGGTSDERPRRPQARRDHRGLPDECHPANPARVAAQGRGRAGREVEPADRVVLGPGEQVTARRVESTADERAAGLELDQDPRLCGFDCHAHGVTPGAR